MFDRERPKPVSEIDANQTFDRVRADIARLFQVPLEHITEASTVDDLGLDSIDYVELLFHLEIEFNIEIDDREFAELKTFGEMVNHVRSLASET